MSLSLFQDNCSGVARSKFSQEITREKSLVSYDHSQQRTKEMALMVSDAFNKFRLEAMTKEEQYAQEITALRLQILQKDSQLRETARLHEATLTSFSQREEETRKNQQLQEELLASLKEEYRVREETLKQVHQAALTEQIDISGELRKDIEALKTENSELKREQPLGREQVSNQAYEAQLAAANLLAKQLQEQIDALKAPPPPPPPKKLRRRGFHFFSV